MSSSQGQLLGQSANATQQQPWHERARSVRAKHYATFMRLSKK